MWKISFTLAIYELNSFRVPLLLLHVLSGTTSTVTWPIRFVIYFSPKRRETSYLLDLRTNRTENSSGWEKCVSLSLWEWVMIFAMNRNVNEHEAYETNEIGDVIVRQLAVDKQQESVRLRFASVSKRRFQRSHFWIWIIRHGWAMERERKPHYVT